MTIVTIRGTLGSGAPEIGKLIADKLHVDYVDREIIEQVAQHLRSSKRGIEVKEMPPGNFAEKIADAFSRYGAMGGGLPEFQGVYLPAWEIPMDDSSYLAGLEFVIRDLAESNSIVIRGRGSQFILKNHPGALHVLTVAPLELRVKRVMEDMKVDEQAAQKEIARFDSSRREFIKRYFQTELENPINYDLVINTEHLIPEAAASVVIDTLTFKERSLNDPIRTG